MTDQMKLDYFTQGILYFNNKKFFESHEEWEQIWLQCTNKNEKLFFQSMILLAGVGVHLQKNRPAPAQRLKILGESKLKMIQDTQLQGYADQLKQMFLSVLDQYNQKIFQIKFNAFLFKED